MLSSFNVAAPMRNREGNMEELLRQLMGKEVDVSCGTSAVVRGLIVDIKDGVLYLRDEEDNVTYVVVANVAFIWEVTNKEPRAGFMN